MRAHVEDLDACLLELRSPGAPPLRSRVDEGGPADIAWSWRVPPRARGALWRGSLSCWRDRASAPGAAPNQRRALSVAVTGPASGEPAIAPAGVAPTVEPGPRESDPKWTDKGEFAVGLLGFVLTLVGLYFVWRQVRAAKEQLEAGKDQLEQTYEQGLADRTAQLVERYQRHDFLEMWSRVRFGFLAASDVTECHERIQAYDEAPHAGSKLVVKTPVRRPAPTLSEVAYAANFHEEIGVLFNTTKVSSEQLIRHFSEPFVTAFDATWWWLQLNRGSKLPAADPKEAKGYETENYVEWQRMVRAILRARPELAPEPQTDVWVVCRPDELALPRWRHVLRRPLWRRHRRLSERLTRPLADIDALVDALDPAPLDRDTPRVICVPPWQAADDRQLRVRELAVRVQALLEQDDGLEQLEAVAGSLDGSA
ncbi:MAG TPA: hypothetical protein VF712_05675 [Thermoleophilaceae bacterium]